MANDPDPGPESARINSAEPNDLSTDELRSEIEQLDDHVEELEERIRDFTRRRDHLMNELQDRLDELEGFVEGDER